MKRPWSLVALALLVAILILAAGFLLRRGDAPLILATTPVGQHPSLLAIAPWTGHAFVLNQGSLAQDSSGGIVPGSISVLDTRTGKTIRTVPAGTAPQAIAVSRRTGHVFVLNSYMHNGGNGTVIVLDARSGRSLHTVRVGNLSEDIVLDDGRERAFVLNENNLPGQTHADVSVLDMTSGRVVGSINVGPNLDLMPQTGTLAIDARHGRGFAATGGGPRGPLLVVFDTRKDIVLRKMGMGTVVGSVVADERTGHVFVFGGNSIQMLDSATGRTLRTIPGPYLNYGGALIDEQTGRLFVALLHWSAKGYPTSTGSVLVIDARSGAVLRQVQTAWPNGMAVNTRTGHVLVTSAAKTDSSGHIVGEGQITVLNGRTGVLVKRISMGAMLGAIAVDPHAGRVLVVDAGGSTRIPDLWGWMPDAVRRKIPFLPPPGQQTRPVPPRVLVLDATRL